jgi:uncharacterized protein (TIGR03435 family)
MLKTLLADRFKLSLDVEKRDTAVYALRPGPKGHTLTPAARDCSSITATDLPVSVCGSQGGPAKVGCVTVTSNCRCSSTG